MKRTEIAPGVHLSYDPAQKFNRCRISIHFAFPARRETATAHALLPLVMERGYADCPDMTQMTKKLARLYGADLTVDARPMGCSHNLCVSITGIKDQFALEGETVALRRCVVSVEADGNGFAVMLTGQRRAGTPPVAESVCRQLEALCEETIVRAWQSGADLLRLGAVRALKEGPGAFFTTKNACPEVRASVKMLDL